MSTLALGGRISIELVDEEIRRLQSAWKPAENDAADQSRARQLLGDEQWESLDEFDRAQLVRVIEVCFRSRSLSEAGRALFNNSRKQRSVANDADRLRKYLARFRIEFKAIASLNAGAD
jgi:transcriptional regulatory protein RtcR